MATVAVLNQTDQKQPLSLQLLASDGFVAIEKTTYSQEIAPGEEAICRFCIRVQKGAQGTLHFEGTLGPETLRRTLSIPLASPIAPVQKIELGFQDKAGHYSISHHAGSFEEGTGKITLSVASRPEVHFLSSLSYLLGYPHGCLEQTTSKAFPLLYLDTMLPFLATQGSSVPQTKDYVSSGIQRLTLMQTCEGALSMWPGDEDPYPWGTAYAAHFLVEAAKKGYEVPSFLSEGVLTWLLKRRQRYANDDRDREIQAYATYVLALAQKITYADMAHQITASRKYTALEANFLYCAGHLLGKQDEVAFLFPKALPPRDGIKDFGDNLHSPIRNQALYLAALLETDPQNSKIAEIANNLSAIAPDGNWGSTQENAWALLALGKYFARFSHTLATPSQGTVHLGGKPLLEWNTNTGAPLVLPLPPNPIVFEVEAQGPFFYRLVSEGVPTGSIVEPYQKGISLSRKLYQGKKEIQNGKVSHGELLTLECLLRAGEAYKNIVLEQLLPAGLEIENPRLTNTASLLPEETEQSADQKINLDFQHANILDDRVCVFFALQKNRTYRLILPLRATTPGSFSFPATSVSCMYAPQIRANTASTALVIGE